MAYERFVAALRAGSGLHVWRGLTPEAQAELARRVGVPGGEEKAVLERFAVRPGWPLELDLPRTGRLVEGAGAEVRVVRGQVDHRDWSVRLVRVDGAWKVDIFGSSPQ